MRRLSRRLRAVDNENGLGLVELLIAAAVGLVLMAAVGGAFINTAKITNFTVQNRNSTQSASNAMQEILEVIHLATKLDVAGTPPTTASAIVTATQKQLVIYSLVDVTDPVNPAPSRVTLDIASGSLVDSRCVAKSTNGYWTFGTCASTSTRTVAGTFVDPVGTQNSLFTYLDANGVVLPTSGGVLPATSIPLVGSIIVSVNLLAPGSTNGPAYLQSKTGMPNVGIQTEIN